MEHRATHGSGGMRPHVLSTHLGGRVRVAAGDTVYGEPEHVTQPIGDGLRILVILEGAMRLRAVDAPELTVDGPTTLAVCCDGKAERDQTFAEGRPFRCVLVEIDRQLVAEERGSDPDAFLRATSGCHDTRQLVVNVVKSLPKLTPFRVECWPLPVEAGCDMPRAPIGALGMSRRGAWDDGVEISFGS